MLREYPGFHASTADQYAQGFRRALSLSPQETLDMRRRARRSAERFTDKGFADKWLQNMDQLVTLQKARGEQRQQQQHK